jgi:hypothetical protein
LHAGAARSPRAGNKVTKLPHRTSLLELRIVLPSVADRKEEAGLRLFSVESALIACSPHLFFEQRDGCPRGVADDTGRVRSFRPTS